MTKLEHEIFEAIRSAERYDEHQEALNAAKVARAWISKAVRDSSETYMDGFLENWFTENDTKV